MKNFGAYTIVIVSTCQFALSYYLFVWLHFPIVLYNFFAFPFISCICCTDARVKFMRALSYSIYKQEIVWGIRMCKNLFRWGKARSLMYLCKYLY